MPTSILPPHRLRSPPVGRYAFAGPLKDFRADIDAHYARLDADAEPVLLAWLTLLLALILLPFLA